MKPILVDFFCCAGGAAKGYERAGFRVVGVDIDPQPRYPYEFIRADALEALDALLSGAGISWSQPSILDRRPLRLTPDRIAAIHASPPCQGYSVTKGFNKRSSEYPLLIGPVRDRLKMTGKPWVIENVEGARSKMIDPVILCGSQFGIRSERNGHPVYLKRHRLFESNFEIPDHGLHEHRAYGRAWPVYGHGIGGTNPEWMKGPGAAELSRELMGIDWTTRRELDESIPPVYTEYVGGYMMRAVENTRIREAA